MKSCKYCFDTEAKQNYDHVHAIYDHVGSQQVVYYINNGIGKTFAYCRRDPCLHYRVQNFSSKAISKCSL